MANPITTPGRIGAFNTNTSSAVTVTFPQASYDWRVRISLAPNSTYFYNDPLGNAMLNPLVRNAGQDMSLAAGSLDKTGQTRIGVVFPYTPTVSVTHTANYSKQQLVHSNYANYFYESSEVGEITLNGEFTVQNVNEGQYLLATIYFFRSITKMFFGQDPQAGNPPPLVYLNGYGQHYLPNVPCIVKSFQHTMPDSADYIDIPEPVADFNPYTTAATLQSTRLPTTSTVQVTVQPVYSRYAQSQNFSLNDFARGALVNNVGTGMPASSFGVSVFPQSGGIPGNGGFI